MIYAPGEVHASSTAEPRAPATRRGPLDNERRRRLTHRAVPLVVLAAVSFAVGLVIGALHVPAERKAADRFVRAWERGDYVAMYDQVSDDAKRTAPLLTFVDRYREAAATATATRIEAGKARDPQGDVVSVPIRIRTRIFGTLRATLRLPFTKDGSAPKVDWRPELTFPGVAPGQRLQRRTTMPPRAAILARDSSPLAQGPDRTSPLGPVAADITGRVGPVPANRRLELRAFGVPDDAQVGLAGLERIFDRRLAGSPGGVLSVSGRTIGTARARPGRPVHSTISPPIEQAAVAALGGRLGGVAVMRPRDGQVLALAGVAFSALQPPGSTFKIITTTGALEAGIVKLSDTFPVQSGAILSGVRLANANNELCGGTFVQAFAESCNSVFAPLGAKLGARRLVATARRFGFDEPIGIPGAATSTIPRADQVGDELAVGSTAIGQGKVQATALQMASAAATIGNRGRRVRPTLLRGERARVVRATSPRIARIVRRLMVEVVRSGTGTAAALPGVVVAGKTGTAELGNAPGGIQIPGDTDAWFAAFAPARHPRVAVGVLVVRAGAGGDVAAPIARQVLAQALSR